MPWYQRTIKLTPKRRGFHLITSELLSAAPEIKKIRVGLLHLFILHTSASLTVNENADPDVRTDLEMSFNAIVPESLPYVHTLEGSDDMPAHIKAAMIGNSVSVPIQNGQPLLGTWQGIYLCEHRNHGGARQVVVTIHGEE